jgi:hypothetical protein
MFDSPTGKAASRDVGVPCILSAPEKQKGMGFGSHALVFSYFSIVR